MAAQSLLIFQKHKIHDAQWALWNTMPRKIDRGKYGDGDGNEDEARDKLDVKIPTMVNYLYNISKMNYKNS